MSASSAARSVGALGGVSGHGGSPNLMQQITAIRLSRGLLSKGWLDMWGCFRGLWLVVSNHIRDGVHAFKGDRAETIQCKRDAGRQMSLIAALQSLGHRVVIGFSSQAYADRSSCGAKRRISVTNLHLNTRQCSVGYLRPRASHD